MYPGASISSIPQDLKFAGEKTETFIGDNTVIRECVTISHGTSDKFRTEVGKNCLLICYLASDDDPAPMWEIMSWLAEQLKCQPPTVKVTHNHCVMNKRCNNQRLKALGYKFLYPSYKDGYIELIK